MIAARIFILVMLTTWLFMPKPVRAQISLVEFGPVGGPNQWVGHYDQNTAQWVQDNQGTITLPKGGTYQFIVFAGPLFNGDVNLVGLDWLNEQYSAASMGMDPKCSGHTCAVLTLYCDGNAHRLHGSSTVEAIEGNDEMVIQTKGANPAERPIGRFKCVNSTKCPISDTEPTGCVSPRGDELHVPANAVGHSLAATFSSPGDMPSPGAVPATFEPITESIELSPHDVTLNLPATLVIHYSDAEARGLDESSLAVFRFDEGSGSWLPVPGSVVDEGANTLTFQTLTFGIFGYTEQPGPTPTRPITWGRLKVHYR